MKIAISYPPLLGAKGTPMLSQNRQFQYFSEPTYVYPVIPAYAATSLDHDSHEIIWDDGIAEGKEYGEWLEDISRRNPDLIMIETKTPVVKKHWHIADDVKQINPDTKVVMVGDHVTALPRESMERSGVDYVLQGGDYDFLMLGLVRYLNNEAEELPPGIWHRQNGIIENTGPFRLDRDLDSLPFIDRDLTSWKTYAFNNGNFKATPGMYLMVGRDCWWRKAGGCVFCSWPTLYPSYRVMSTNRALDEIGFLIEKYRVKEIFDDTGTFPVGRWLKQFSEGMIDRRYNDRVRLSCNMRFGVLKPDDYRLMRKAGFRMLLFGVESASQSTLDTLNKGIHLQDIIDGCRWATEAGLEPHITIMIGYPWETRRDILNTLKFAKTLMQKGWVATLQSTVLVPYPGTKLYQQALDNGWFRIDPRDYDRFDMSEPVLKTGDTAPDEIVQLCDDVYKLFLSPTYILRQLARMRSRQDLAFAMRGIQKVLGHLRDFAPKSEYATR
jgi:radical SAM superfamily enzyme YgiQ (UPF0313 family)